MDYGVAEQNDVVNGHNDYQLKEHYPDLQQQHHHRGLDGGYSSIDDSSAGHQLNHSNIDSSAGKLFVGGIAWETTEESFAQYFSKYGEITDAVIMMDRVSGRPRGFGFVTFADPEAAKKVLLEEHVIDGRTVEVKKTVPREDMQGNGVWRTKKIFVGGLPLSLTEDDIKEYFSSYGYIIEHQILIDRNTGRSRGFGFVTFENEVAVDRIFSDGGMHELGGKKVEIKRAEPKRAGFSHGNESRQHGGSSSSKSYGRFSSDAAEYGGGYGGYMGRGYGGFKEFGGYGRYAGNLGGAAAGFYAGYGGYGYGVGFGGAMYGGAGNGVGNYGTSGAYGIAAGYGSSGYGGGRGFAGSAGVMNLGGVKGYQGGFSGSGNSKGYDNGGPAGGRFHPYQKPDF